MVVKGGLWISGIWLFFFFFQAEDGIRDWSVTGVQTCALPICCLPLCGYKISPHFSLLISTVLQLPLAAMPL